MTNTAATYQELIREAFIAPIRTVTVIDDEYPTFQQLLEPSADPKLSDHKNIDRLKKITSMCHETHNWSLDVFDGQSPKIAEDNDIPEHLNHSDLLILDYHLDGKPPEDNGERARKIIKKLDSNNHFNIILVHTKGNTENIKDVYEEILFDLHRIRKPSYLNVSDESTQKIDAWLDDNEDGFGYRWTSKDILHSKTDILKLLEYNEEKLFKSIRSPEHLLNAYDKELEKLSQLMGVEIKDLINWRLLEICKEHQIAFTDELRGDFKWDWTGDVNYIATGKVFISVIRKVSENPEEELFFALCESLNHFNAPPMHLLMAKIRHEIDERGFEQAQSIMSNRLAQAGWLYSLLSNHQDVFAHDKAIDLHWEQLGRASKASLRLFSQRLSTALLNTGNNKAVVKQFFKDCIGQKEQSCGHLNAFTCSMPVVGTHLNTGTVFSIDNEFWVCLTPACDLVPDQKISQWEARIGSSHLAFKAVRLHEVNLSRANGSANSNEFLYLNSESFSELKTFVFAEGESPTWDTFYASNQGRFDSEKNINLSCVRATKDGLSINNFEAKIISELRYEYALNLLQRLGSNQTRVGLDFIERDKLW